MGLEPDLRWYSEIDKDACKVIARHTNAPNLGDVKLIDWSKVEPVDILTVGYPCQGESLAGKRKGADDDRWIWPWIADAIRVLRPRIVLAENVAAHLTLGFPRVLGDLASLGFDVEWTTLRASDVGACHQRDRIFWAATDALRSGGWEDTRAARRDEAEHAGGGSEHRDQPLGDGEAVAGDGSDGQRPPAHANGSGLSQLRGGVTA
jgi:DNA (cytosine-5)-methyltransferase 1